MSYNRATYDGDYFSGGERIATAGKTVVDAPRWLYKSELAYRRGAYHLQLQADCSRRASTYSNDRVGPRPLAVQPRRRRRPRPDRRHRPGRTAVRRAQPFDRKYVSTVGTSGYTASGDYPNPAGRAAAAKVFVTLKLSL